MLISSINVFIVQTTDMVNMLTSTYSYQQNIVNKLSSRALGPDNVILSVIEHQRSEIM